MNELAALGLDVTDGLVPSASLRDAAIKLGQFGVKGRGLAAQAVQEGADHRTASSASARASLRVRNTLAWRFDTASKATVGMRTRYSPKMAQ